MLVRCPRCHHDMRYEPQAGLLTAKAKRCVYCGSTFKVHASLPASRIVPERA